MRKQIKCVKCGLYYKDRGTDDPSGFIRTLCFKCGTIWKFLGLCIQGMNADRLNRYVILDLDKIIIKKKRKLSDLTNKQ